ncbi:flagellar hook-length control protein FliK, partial [Burkholderia sp. 3C]
DTALDAHDVAQDGDLADLPGDAAADVADRAGLPMPSIGAAFAGIAPALAMALDAGSAAGGEPAAMADPDVIAPSPAGRAPVSLADVVHRMVDAQADVMGRASSALRSRAGQGMADAALQAAPAAPAVSPLRPAQSVMSAEMALPAAFAPAAPSALASRLPAEPASFTVRRQPAAIAGDAPADAAPRLPTGTVDVSPTQPATPAGVIAAPVTTAPIAASASTAAFVAKADAASPDASERALLSALGDRIHMQAAQGVQRAVIRLDPHLAGSVVIDLRHEAGAVSVQLSASHADVARQLQTMSESLRQDLASRQYTEVSVQVAPHRGTGREPGAGSGGPGEGRDPQQRDTRRPGRALGEADAAHAFEFASR